MKAFLILALLVSSNSYAGGTNSRVVAVEEAIQCHVAGKGMRTINSIELLHKGNEVEVSIEFEGEGWDIWGEGDFTEGPFNLVARAEVSIAEIIFGQPIRRADRSLKNLLKLIRAAAAKSKHITNCSIVGDDKAAVGAQLPKNIEDSKRGDGKYAPSSSESYEESSGGAKSR